MAIASPNLKSLEFGKDLTEGGKDNLGKSVALMLGAAAGAAAATLTADKMGSEEQRSRKLVGGAVGGLVGCLVTGGCSGSDNKLGLAGMVLGSVLGVMGASLLGGDGAKKSTKKSGTTSSGSCALSSNVNARSKCLCCCASCGRRN